MKVVEVLKIPYDKWNYVLANNWTYLNPAGWEPRGRVQMYKIK